MGSHKQPFRKTGTFYPISWLITSKMVLFASYMLSLVLTSMVVEVVESSVSCGRHEAPSCRQCGPWYWCNGDCFWSESQQICKLLTVSCGRHQAPSCGDCGHRNWCNGDCTWSDSQQICEYRYNNELFPITIAIAYDQTFSEQMKGDKMAVKAIKTIIRDANKKMGPESTLQPPVRLQVKGDIYRVDVDVPLKVSGAIATMPRSLRKESIRKGVPFVLITGKGGMSGIAFWNICRSRISKHEGAYAVSSCDLSNRHNLAWCSNVLVHEMGHLMGMGHDIDYKQMYCPHKSGHMSSQHTKWSPCSNRQWQLTHRCLQGGRETDEYYGHEIEEIRDSNQDI